MRIQVLSPPGYQRVIIAREATTRYVGVIAVHDITRGPALGGTRLRPYQNEAEAMTDALLLAESMTLKSAFAGLPFGGGKAVVIEPRGTYDRAALLHAHGRAVDALGGDYITAEDVGTTPADLLEIRCETKHALNLCGELGATVLHSDDATRTPCDVFAPCALGGVINQATAESLTARVIAGSANNQLAASAVAERLRQLGIVYVPDFVANAGGVIAACKELLGWSQDRVIEKIDAIRDSVLQLIAEADRKNVTPLGIARARALG